MAELKRDKNELMLDQLQSYDPEITTKVAFSRNVVVYELSLSAEGGNPTWKKHGAEGVCYYLRRKTDPPVQILVKSVTSGEDFKEHPHMDWELDCKPNYVFYKSEDPTQAIRGLWFPDDSDRMKFEEHIKQFIDAKREESGLSVERVPGKDTPDAEAHSDVKEQLASMGLQGPSKGPQTVQVSKTSLRTGLHGLVDDDKFLQMMMQKLYEMTGGQAPLAVDKKNTGKRGENKPRDLQPQQR